MTIYFAGSTGGFYSSMIHLTLPEDAVEVSAEDYAALLAAQSTGRTIIAGATGAPELADIVERTEAELLAERRASMVVSRFQARAALHQAGLLEAAAAAVATADAIVQIAWADAQEFRRTSATITAIGAYLGLTDAEIDTLFEDAAQISA